MEGSKPNLAHVWGKNLISRPALFFLRGGFDPIQIGWGLWVESRLPFIPYVDPKIGASLTFSVMPTRHEITLTQIA